ncbi:MAG TPA: hypothetical protein VN736_05400 [Candidatus Limnocylindrales bacterium]|nr:hypothetical protein [Candidatus Limnocylindrales bacterium]
MPVEAKARPQKEEAGADGSFQFTSVVPGKYKLLVWEELDEDQWQDPDLIKDRPFKEITVGPKEAQTVRLVQAAEHR